MGAAVSDIRQSGFALHAIQPQPVRETHRDAVYPIPGRDDLFVVFRGAGAMTERNIAIRKQDDDECWCPICDQEFVVGDEVVVAMNNWTLFPNVFVHKACVGDPCATAVAIFRKWVGLCEAVAKAPAFAKNVHVTSMLREVAKHKPIMEALDG